MASGRYGEAVMGFLGVPGNVCRVRGQRRLQKGQRDRCVVRLEAGDTATVEIRCEAMHSFHGEDDDDGMQLQRRNTHVRGKLFSNFSSACLAVPVVIVPPAGPLRLQAPQHAARHHRGRGWHAGLCLHCVM